jgi:cytidylate kinase
MNSSSNERPAAPAVIIVMGVSGSGKSTVASLLALRLHWEFEDGDWFHPAVNIEKMHNGTLLTDDDRSLGSLRLPNGLTRSVVAAITRSSLARRSNAAIAKCSSATVPMSASSISKARRRLSHAASPPARAFHAEEPFA